MQCFTILNLSGDYEYYNTLADPNSYIRYFYSQQVADNWNMKYECRPSLDIVLSQHPYSQQKMNDATQKIDDSEGVNLMA